MTRARFVAVPPTRTMSAGAHAGAAASASAAAFRELAELGPRRRIRRRDAAGQGGRADAQTRDLGRAAGPDERELAAPAADVDDEQVALDRGAAGDPEQREQRLLLVAQDVERRRRCRRRPRRRSGPRRRAGGAARSR